MSDNEKHIGYQHVVSQWEYGDSNQHRSVMLQQRSGAFERCTNEWECCTYILKYEVSLWCVLHSLYAPVSRASIFKYTRPARVHHQLTSS